MSYMIKKGMAWLEKDFLEQLDSVLSTNHVVDIGKLVNFEGRDKYIAEMIVRGDIEEATPNDVEKQGKVDRQRKAETLIESNRSKQMEEEEANLRQVMGL